MPIKLVLMWTLAFGFLISTTLYVTHPRDANATIAYAKQNDENVVVMDYSLGLNEKREELRQKIWNKLLSVFVRKDLICSVSGEQFDELQNRYEGTKLETMEIDGEEVSFVEIPRDEAPAGQILKFLREEEKPLHCTVVPRKAWYLLLFGGGVS